MASPNKPAIDFVIIDTHSKMTMGIGDTSIYPVHFIIQNPTYEITPPSFPKVNITYESRGMMLFNSNDFGITCGEDDCSKSDLPDGIWKIRASITPPNQHFKEKSFMRTEVIEEKLGRAFLLTDLISCDSRVKERDKDTLDQIRFYIIASVAEANRYNDKLAIEYYDTANKMLDIFISKKC